MVVANGEVDTEPVLIGWTRIAAAMGVSAPTARRWTKQFNLPVYKLGGQVRADGAELREKLIEIKKVWANMT